MLLRRFALSALIILPLISSCGGGGSDGPTGTGGGTPVTPAAVQSVSLSATTAQLFTGTTSALTASVSVTGGASTAVDWTTSNAAVATVSGGTITAVTAGTATITATSQADKTKSASAAVTVTSVTPTIASITQPTVSTASQTVTVTGTNFVQGLTVTIGPARFLHVTQTIAAAQIQALTSTSFQISGLFNAIGTFTVQITNPGGEKSTVQNLATKYATSGVTWIPEGVRVDSATLAGPESGVADPMMIRLTDGRWRMVFNATSSAISNDGLTFTKEVPRHAPSAYTVDGALAFPILGRVFVLSNGNVRAYFGCNCTSQNAGIYSATSTDEGANWTMDSGIRIKNSATPLNSTFMLSGLSVVPTKDGKFRGYFSGQAAQSLPTTPIVTLSAVSTDLITWTMDPGVRVGPGATLSGAAFHPKAIVNADGSITLFYYRFTTPNGSNAANGSAMVTSTSADGLAFTNETVLTSLGSAGDPDVVRVGTGLRMYYNWGDDSGGTIYSALSASGAASIRASLAASKTENARGARSRK